MADASHCAVLMFSPLPCKCIGCAILIVLCLYCCGVWWTAAGLEVRGNVQTLPRKSFALPMTSRRAALLSNRASSPPHRKMSVPCSAGAFDPDTGASK